MKYKILAVSAIMSLNFVTLTSAQSFNDIKGDEWYSSYIQELSDKNIINGYSDGTFRAKNTMTIGELLKILITSLGETPSENNGSHWALGYAQRAYELSLISDPNMNLNQDATRFFAIQMIASVLKVDDINVNSPFTDIDNSTVNTLHELNIVEGAIKNDELNFYGDSFISRAEICALISRTMEIMEKNIYEQKYVHPSVTTVDTPTTSEEFENILLNSVLTNEYETFLSYPDINFFDMSETYQYHNAFIDAFISIFDKYPEYFTFANHLSAPMTGNNQESDITVTLESSYFALDEIVYMKSEFFSEVEDIHRVLRLNGTLDTSMNQYDRAKAIFEWIVLNNEYDLYMNKVSFTSYGLIQNNKGVCQAYVSLFNALCKMEGIEVTGMSGIANGQEHIWSVAILDGKECIIDPTFADPVPDNPDYCDFYFFDISEENLKNAHNF